jgi:hypothetical protein
MARNTRFNLLTLGTAAFVVAIAVAAGQARSQSLDVGLTGDLKRGDLGGTLELHGLPVFTQPSGISGGWGVAARAETDGDVWVGGGFVLDVPLSDAAFVEASFMPGFYHPGDTELGGNLQFRSLVGVGWRVSPAGAVILSLDHMSNAGLEDFNPGTETVALRYRMEF